jgi:hypothetical protein
MQHGDEPSGFINCEACLDCLCFSRLARPHEVNPHTDEAQAALFKRPSSYLAVNTFHLGYKNQSVYAVSGTSRCLF